MRVAGIDRPRMLEQWFRMGGAQNLEEFKTALRIESVPMWNANYADADGHIMLVFNGLVPKRNIEDFQYWSKVVPGNTSKTLWTGYHSFDDLPKSIDPPAGFNQNANEPPWLTTIPQLDPAKYPAYIAPSNVRMPSFRTMRSLRMISQDKSITYDQLLAYKHSTRMELADALLPDLLKAAGSSSDAAVKDAARVLDQWDRQTETGSRGAVLFQMFADRHFGKNLAVEDKLRVKYDPQHPLDSANGLADLPAALQSLAAAAEECKRLYGSLDVPWGDVYRYVRGKKELPGNGDDGKMGVFRTVQYTRKEGNKYYVTHGETFVCAIEFGAPQRAQCLLGYGNASQTGSVHIDDQLQFMVEKKLLPVWRERKDIEAHLERKDTF
jgi:acyl-homoserine-lactone acylase